VNNGNQTRRPLGSSTALGYPLSIPANAPVNIHEYDSSSVQNGGAYTDTVTLYLSNSTPANILTTITVAGGTPLIVTVLANASLLVLDGIPTRGVSGTPTYVTGQAAAAGVVAFGYFTRA
jgi:uncharacterized metal-binding protein